MTFGEQVALAREKMGLTQKEAVEQIKKKYSISRLSDAYLSMIERDERTNLSSKLKEALINFFGLEKTNSSSSPFSPDVTIAASLKDAARGLTEDEIDEVVQFIAFQKSKKKDPKGGL